MTKAEIRTDKSGLPSWQPLCNVCAAPVSPGVEQCSACGAPVVNAREQLRPFNRAARRRFKDESAKWWAEHKRQYLTALALQFSSPIPLLAYSWYFQTQFTETEWLERAKWFDQIGKYWLYGSAFVLAVGQLAAVVMLRRIFRLPSRTSS